MRFNTRKVNNYFILLYIGKNRNDKLPINSISNVWEVHTIHPKAILGVSGIANNEKANRNNPNRKKAKDTEAGGNQPQKKRNNNNRKKPVNKDTNTNKNDNATKPAPNKKD